MGVRTLTGNADGSTHAAAMYCSTSGWMIGPIWEADDAEEQIDAFLLWLGESRWALHLQEIFSSDPDFMGRHRHPLGDGRDPREWADSGMERLVAYWRGAYTEDGLLLDVDECECGHGRDCHVDDEDSKGCFACDPLRRTCMEWKPGNRAAALAVADREGGS